MITEQHNRRQRAYYRSADHPTILPVESPYVMRHIEKLISRGGLERGAKILEVGAGIGRFSRLLRTRGLDVTASDISPELTTVLQQHSPDIPSFVSDVNELPDHHNEKYDAVFSFANHNTLDGLTSFSIQDYFKKVWNCLKSDGILFFESHELEREKWNEINDILNKNFVIIQEIPIPKENALMHERVFRILKKKG